MKKLSQFILEANLDVKDNAMNFVSGTALEEYVSVTKKFLSAEAKYVIQWLIDNNATYVQQLSGGKSGNALAIFYAGGVPADDNLKDLYKALGELKKNASLLEVPVFQDEKTFEDIMSKKVSLDEIILDLNSTKGRDAVVRKFTPLVWKIARSMVGQSNFDLDELVGFGFEGLTIAMNKYGKKTEHNKVDEETLKTTTFFSFAGQKIRTHILDMIVDQSHLVHIPKNQQAKEKELTGRNTRNFSVSGDQAMGHDDNGNAKSMFDTMGAEAGTEEGGRSIDMEDKAKLWERIFQAIKQKFDEKTVEIWSSLYGANGHEKMKNKEICQKYDLSPSKVTYYAVKINNYILHDPKMRAMAEEIRELMA